MIQPFRLLSWLVHLSNQKMQLNNSVDPDQTAPAGAVWSGTTLFPRRHFRLIPRISGYVVVLHAVSLFSTKNEKVKI